MEKNRDLTRFERRRLVRLTRRFGSPGTDIGEDDFFAMWWWRAALAGAIANVVPEDWRLLSKARVAEDDRDALVELWQEVAGLPYQTVDELVAFVHRQREIWDLDDSACGSWEVRE